MMKQIIPPDDYREQVDLLRRELRLAGNRLLRLEQYPEFNELEWAEAGGHIADAEACVAKILRDTK